MSIAFIGLGGNLGDPAATLQSALQELDRVQGTRLLKCSGFYRSRPVGPGPQPDYVNAVAQVESSLSPHALLDELIAIETRHGRIRDGRHWGPRTLDLDLLIYGELVLNDARLTLPHPEITHRNFVLVPLLELAPDMIIPGEGPAREALQRIGTAGIERLAGDKVACGKRLDEE